MPDALKLVPKGVVLLLLVSAQAVAELRRVPQEYATIQAALDAVAEDDTVLVSLGTYAEELSAPPFRFWLIGDVPADTGDFERPVVDPSSLSNPPSRRCLTIPDGCQPTVERMKFVNRATMYPPADPLGSGGVVVNTQAVAAFRFCSFDSVYRAIVHDVPPGLPVHFVVEDCRFTDSPRAQVRTDDSGRVEIRRSQFHAHRCTSQLVVAGQNSVIEDCIFDGDSVGGAISLHGEDLAVRGCVFGPIDTCAVTCIRLNSLSGAMLENNLVHDVNVKDWLAYLEYFGGEPVTVRHNVFVDNGIYRVPGTAPTTGMLAAQYLGSEEEFNVRVDSNLFQNEASHADTLLGNALTIWTPTSVCGNRFSEAAVSLAPEIYTSTGHMRTRLRYCQFAAQDYAVRSPFTNADAAWNWWGDGSGPYNAIFNPQGLGARVDDVVLFDPWCPDTNCFLSVPGIGQPLPQEFVLEAYPNPFNSTVHLTLIPSAAGIVKLELFDRLGRQVQELWHGPLAFQKNLTFDASALSSGIYFARVTDVISRKNLAMRKLVLLR